ncbi:unnamed protein product [Phytophthora fragariaefolia]|uniref:Unnamed protein product n=1 Tax=Phytophthora fragariaefolia TaxID=1490495 RepID=A0A9W6TNE3_9STRA|nr:unnamed protein product [Phytophthora fragariaefolia]
MLCSARKPTGMLEMPPHIKRTKEVNQAIDDKANAIVIDDEADRDQGFVGPDFSFEVTPTTTSSRTVKATTFSMVPIGDLDIETNASVAGDTTSSTGASAPPRRVSGLADAIWCRQGARNPSSYASSGATLTNSDRAAYKTSSNRFGGTDLTSFRDAIGAKSVFEEDKETLETSFAKAKRIRAMKATTALKNKLKGLESAANTKGGGVIETIILLREENERKADARRANERSIVVKKRPKPRPKQRSVVAKISWRWKSALAAIARRNIAKHYETQSINPGELAALSRLRRLCGFVRCQPCVHGSSQYETCCSGDVPEAPGRTEAGGSDGCRRVIVFLCPIPPPAAQRL